MQEDIGKDLNGEFGSDCIGESVTMTFILCNCPLMLDNQSTEFHDLSCMFHNPVVDVFHCQMFETFIGNNIVKREDVEAMLKVGVLSHIASPLRNCGIPTHFGYTESIEN